MNIEQGILNVEFPVQEVSNFSAISAFSVVSSPTFLSRIDVTPVITSRHRPFSAAAQTPITRRRPDFSTTDARPTISFPKFRAPWRFSRMHYRRGIRERMFIVGEVAQFRRGKIAISTRNPKSLSTPHSPASPNARALAFLSVFATLRETNYNLTPIREVAKKIECQCGMDKFGEAEFRQNW